jgi:ubiquinone/menaquinone biosynthesis C-methylase UbiE
MAEFKFEEFCNLDESLDADYFMRSMDVMLSFEEIQKIKQESVDFLEIMPGDRVLEVGCGTANDVLLMAKAVGENGQVIAIDSSRKMLDEAKHRIHVKNIHYIQMSAECIQYPDHYFSAVHADRLLVSHENYNDIFREILRVTKPGGIISITDVDAETIVIAPDSHNTRVVLKQILSSFVNPNMGRNLPALFTLHELSLVQIKLNLLTIRDFTTLKKIFDFDRILLNCIKRDFLSVDAADNWLEQMEESHYKQQFLYCVTFFTVVGKKPFPISKN